MPDNDDIFAGRRFSIPYVNTADAHAASTARAHMVTRTQSPGMVIQVGDKVVPIGVSPFETTADPTMSETTTRRYDQLPTFSQDVIKRNIQWQYGEQVEAQIPGEPVKKALEGDAEVDAGADMEKGLLTRILGVDHLFPDKKVPEVKPPVIKVSPVPQAPVSRKDAELSPPRDEPKRLIATAATAVPEDGPKRLFTDVKAAVSQATPMRAATTKPVPTPAPRPAVSSAPVKPTAKASDATSVVAPEATRPVASPKPKTTRTRKAKTAAPTTKPAQSSVGVPEDLKADLEREVEPHEYADVDRAAASEEGPEEHEDASTPDHRVVHMALQHLHDLHAISRPGFDMSAEWRPGNDEDGPPILVSHARHKGQGIEETHELIPHPSGKITHVHSINAPDRPPYHHAETLPSLPALQEHLETRHFTARMGT